LRISWAPLGGYSLKKDSQLRDCQGIYEGGPVETSSCYFENVKWDFHAALNVMAMRQFGRQILPPK